MSGANPGMVGLAISYALGITGKLSGLVTTFTGSFHTDQQQKERKESSTDANTETERELVAVERVQQYVNRIQPEQVREVGRGVREWEVGSGVRVHQLTIVEGLNTPHIQLQLLPVAGGGHHHIPLPLAERGHRHVEKCETQVPN